MPAAAESELRLGVSPRLAEVRALAERGHNLVPVIQTYLEDCETPVSAFLKLRGAGPAFLLESAEQGQRVGRWSFIGYRPRSVVRWVLADGGDPYALAAAEAERHRQAPIPGLPPFAGGAVGFFGYDCVRTVEPLGPPNPDTGGLPDLALMLTDALVAFDHLKHTTTVLANVDADDVEAGYERAVAAIREVRERLAGPLPRPPEALPERQASLLAGITLGDDRAQPADLADAFRAAGLTHLLAVSGQNVAYVVFGVLLFHREDILHHPPGRRVVIAEPANDLRVGLNRDPLRPHGQGLGGKLQCNLNAMNSGFRPREHRHFTHQLVHIVLFPQRLILLNEPSDMMDDLAGAPRLPG